jgi:hypothetical protein
LWNRVVLFGARVLALLSLVACTPPPRHADPLHRCTYEGDCDPVRVRCDAGDTEACLTLGYLYGTATEASAYHQPALGEQYLLRACRLSVLACEGLLDVALTQRGECEADHANETRLIAAGCDAGYPPACVVLADRLVEGVDLPRDTERAARLEAFACDVDDRFPDFTLTGEDGKRVPAKDPMNHQLLACVRAQQLRELGLAGSAAPPRTSLEEAMRRHAMPPDKYRKERLSPPDKVIAKLRADTEWLAMSPKDLEARVVRSRRLRAPILFGCRDIR